MCDEFSFTPVDEVANYRLKRVWKACINGHIQTEWLKVLAVYAPWPSWLKLPLHPAPKARWSIILQINFATKTELNRCNTLLLYFQLCVQYCAQYTVELFWLNWIGHGCCKYALAISTNLNHFLLIWICISICVFYLCKRVWHVHCSSLFNKRGIRSDIVTCNGNSNHLWGQKSIALLEWERLMLGIFQELWPWQQGNHDRTTTAVHFASCWWKIDWNLSFCLVFMYLWPNCEGICHGDQLKEWKNI